MNQRVCLLFFFFLISVHETGRLGVGGGLPAVSLSEREEGVPAEVSAAPLRRGETPTRVNRCRWHEIKSAGLVQILFFVFARDVFGLFHFFFTSKWL